METETGVFGLDEATSEPGGDTGAIESGGNWATERNDSLSFVSEPPPDGYVKPTGNAGEVLPAAAAALLATPTFAAGETDVSDTTKDLAPAMVLATDGEPDTDGIDETTGPAMARGWGAGEHYVLPRDAAGWSIAEPGENHRMVYVSAKGKAGADGLTPQTAVNLQGLDALMKTLRIDPSSWKAGQKDASWHVLFERGYDYGYYSPSLVNGEDPLHPFVIGAYGKGARPLFGETLEVRGTGRSNIVIRDVEFGYSKKAAALKGDDYKIRGIDVLGQDHENLLFENVVVRPYKSGMRLQSDSENITLYRTMILDAHRENPSGGDRNWKDALGNRIGGLFAHDVDGLLIEESLADHNGWENGYKASGARGPFQPPSMYNHNLYLNYTLNDVTLRNNILSQGASFGAQLRSGGVVDGTLFFDNNAGLVMLGGGRDSAGDFLGQYSLLIDSVVTEPSNKNAVKIGARGWGVSITGAAAVVDTIVAQDGNGLGSGPAGVTNPLTLNGDPGTVSLDGVTIYNWGKATDETLPGAPGDKALAAVTLDRFAASELGAGKDRFDLLAQWRSRDVANWDKIPDVNDALAFFRDGFGYDRVETPAGRTVTFEPDPRADGFRWDNRLNWSDDNGPVSGDTVKLDGHAVTYSGETLRLAGLDLGSGGVLRVTHGLLEILAEDGLMVGAGGGLVQLDNAGQFLFNGYGGSGRLALAVDGGRAVNTGTVDGRIDVAVTDGQMLLAEAGGVFALGNGSRLEIRGDAARVGFDGPSGEAGFGLDGGALVFVFDDDGVSPITEFRSGRHGTAAPETTSVVDMAAGTLVIDLTALDPIVGDRRFTLVDVDQLHGALSGIAIDFVGAAPGMDPALVWDSAAAALYLDIGGLAVL